MKDIHIGRGPDAPAELCHGRPSAPRRGLLLAFLLVGIAASGQTFFLKESFPGASGLVPPAGWQAIRLSGGGAAGFRFDNPRSVQVAYPLQAPFALFDAAAAPMAGTSQSVALESPTLNLGGTTRLLLSFDHQFTAASESVGRLQVRAGGVWTDVAVYTVTTNAGQTEVYDLSPQLAGRTDGAIRFLWSGKAEGHWAVDNVKLFAPLSVDAGIASIDMPRNPFGEGTTDIRVTLANYGSDILNGVDIRWSVNGVAMRDTSWSGSLDFAAREPNLRIGRMDLRAGVNYTFKIWTEDPNGVYDANPSNDTIIRSLIPSLCGTYTIGGANPNFPTVTRAVEFLHSAGIGCPVVMKIRDGVYNEQLELKTVKGSSPVNTITFESESGDSSKVLLTSPANVTSYRYTMNLNGARHVRFRKMGFSKQGDGGYHALAISGRSFDIEVQNCGFVFTGSPTSNIFILDQADSVRVWNCDFVGEGGNAVNMSTTGEVHIRDNRFWNWYGNTVVGNASRIVVERNQFQRSDIAILINAADSALISGNRIRFAEHGIGIYGGGRIRVERNLVNFNSRFGIYTEATRPVIINNRIWNQANRDLNTRYGIYVGQSSGAKVMFNSVRMYMGNIQSAALSIHAVDSLVVMSNILSMRQSGYPFLMQGKPRVLLSDRNAYHSPRGFVGQMGGTIYKSMSAWRSAISGEARGVFADPGFRNDSSFIPTLIYLDGTGTPGTGVLRDFDDSLRSSSLPDIGASEFAPCPLDAAIEAVEEPTIPLEIGVRPFRVRLRNNGSAPLTTIRLAWSVNGVMQRDTVWTGSLATAQTELFQVGVYDFTSPTTGYLLRAWVRRDSADCWSLNDTLATDRIYARLCGNYTIGGLNPDFKSFNDAAEPLNTSGVSCPVVFRVRDGVYNEFVKIDSIPGSSFANTITFESESGDSSRVLLTSSQYDQNSVPIQYTLNLSGARHVRLNRIGIEKKGLIGLLVDGPSSDVVVSGCHFLSEGCYAGVVLGGDSMRVLRNTFLGNSHMAVNFSTGGWIEVEDNTILGSRTLAINGSALRARITGNKVYRAEYGIIIFSGDTAFIGRNRVLDADYAIRVAGPGRIHIDANRVNFNRNVGIYSDAQNTLVTNNWVYNLADKDMASQAGIHLQGNQRGVVLFNTVHMAMGGKQSSAFSMDGGDSLLVSSNILSVAQYGYPVYVANRPRGLGLDRNAYYSKYGWVGWRQGHFASMADWRTIMGGEAEGFFANPYFARDSVLIPSQIMLNGTGLQGSQVYSDIDETPRQASAPDIGAKEFEPCLSDAAISSITDPSSPLDVGLRRIRVVLQNNGLSMLSQARIGWSVNGSPARDTLWQGSLPSAQTVTVDIGAFDFRPATEYVIKAWVTLPAPATDCNQSNDTLYSNSMYTRLCGTYTIGGSNPDFQGFREAASFLESAGITCPVVMKVRDGNYTDEMVQIDSIMGSSSTNTITFESESGDSSKALLVRTGVMPNKPYILSLLGLRHVRFHKIGFYQSDRRHVGVLMSGDCRNVWFTNCYFLNNYTNLSITGSSDSIRVLNCTMIGGTHTAVAMRTPGSVVVRDNHFGPDIGLGVEGQVGKLDITRNSFFRLGDAISVSIGDTAYIGGNLFQNTNVAIRFSGSGNIQIEDNRIQGTQVGIGTSGSGRIQVEANRLTDAIRGLELGGPGRYLVRGNRVGFSNGTGILASGLRNSVIANNWVYNQQQLSTNGILLDGCENVRVLFNSVDITGTNNNSSAIAIKDGRDNAVFNNILRNASGGYCMKIVNGSPNLVSDYNCYYAPLNNIGSIDDRIYNYLNQWGTVIGGENNSLFINPFFRRGDYRPNHILLDNAGVRYDPVAQDIDSAARHPVSPDIGVKEFTPCNLDAGVNEFASPTLPLSSGRQDIRVVLQNQGLSTLTQVRIHWSVNGAVQPSFLWTGTLPTRRNTPVTIGAIDLISGPEWTIRAWASSPNGGADCNAYNDTALLFVAGTPNSVPFPPEARDTAVCRGNTAILRAKGVGTIGWYSAATGGVYLGGGSTFTTPPLTAATTYYVQDSMLTASLARTPVRVTVFAPPAFDPFPARLYSRADSVQLKVDTTVIKGGFAWSGGQTTADIHVGYTGGYRVNVVTLDGCRISDSVFVQFPDTAGIHVGMVTAACTVPVEVPVRVSSFRRMSLLQGSLRWDTAYLRFDSLRIQGAPILGLTPGDFDLSRTSDGRLSFRWTYRSTPGRSLPDSTTLFLVRLIPLTGQLGSFGVAMTDTLTPVQSRDDRDTLLRHIRTDGAVQVTACNVMPQGLVFTPNGDGVPNVEMRLSGSDPKTTLTDRNGLYAMVARRGNHILTPYKNNERYRLNGVSTIDLAHIQSHVLFRERFGDPYKVIAADADSSSSVTTMDIMLFRRMLLGLDTSLPGNRTWAFVDADQTFANANQPFPYRNSKSLPDLFGPVTQRFRAIKLGDVNYDRNPKLDSRETGDSLRLFPELVEEPGLLRVRIRARAVLGLLGFQGTLAWDTARLRLLRAEGGTLGVGLGRIPAEEGRLPFSWNDPKAFGLDLTEGFPLVELVFERSGFAGGWVVALNDASIPPEAFDQRYRRMPMSLESARIPAAERSLVLRVLPNPVNGYLTAEWTADRREAVRLSVIDASGRLLGRMEVLQRVGLNRVRMDLGRHGSPGLCLLGIEDAQGMRWTRFVLAR